MQGLCCRDTFAKRLIPRSISNHKYQRGKGIKVRSTAVPRTRLHKAAMAVVSIGVEHRFPASRSGLCLCPRSSPRSGRSLCALSLLSPVLQARYPVLGCISSHLKINWQLNILFLLALSRETKLFMVLHTAKFVRKGYMLELTAANSNFFVICTCKSVSWWQEREALPLSALYLLLINSSSQWRVELWKGFSVFMHNLELSSREEDASPLSSLAISK